MATVTLCHIATQDLMAHTRRAEILVVAVGKAGLISAEHVREGAVVIDVGINRVTLPDGTKKTVGDVDFDAVRDKAASHHARARRRRADDGRDAAEEHAAQRRNPFRRDKYLEPDASPHVRGREPITPAESPLTHPRFTFA